MTAERVSVVTPLSPAWERAKTILFRPFRLEKWLVLGFSAWLAGLTRGGYVGLHFPGPGWGGDARGIAGGARGFGDLAEVLTDAWARIAAAGCFALLALGCLLGIAVTILVLWVSARGKFIFLDNVLHDRAEIVEPWKRFRRLGNSLFRFQLALLAAVLGAVGLAVGGVLLLAGGVAGLGRLESLAGPGAVLAALACAALFLFVGVALLYLVYFLEGFVVPLMHRHDLDVVAAWRRFLTLFRRQPGPLLLSGLLVLAVGLVLGAAVVALGLLTCCLGLILVMLPYVGTVVLLPVWVTYRAYTVELLAQMEPDLLPAAPPAP